ncbi:phage recombination protein Bet [Achromobacter spanius]|uniref:Phage recombination protein Bet n=1 Tax=Achromobacter spanius TaxID=217203 RepID=A0A2S5GXT9_9BURK|nr:phage recombination protein Bet [Achromobacter spanius]PPA77675.1 phage recombination protein Bet [Achromobacter spanius]
MATALTVSNFTSSLATKLAERFGMDANPEIIDVLKKTAFKGDVSDAQMGALLVVANQYGLNPWVKEIYAFPDKGSIVPVVGVDGWARIVNDHPQFNGAEFVMAEDGSAVTCIIHRKDRDHPTRVTEYLAECERGTQPWKSHPRRMLRHKAFMQCGRLAFGFTGIYDRDEAEAIVEKDMGAAQQVPRTAQQFAEQAKPQPAAEVDREQVVRDLEMIARSDDPAEKRIADLENAWKGLTKDERAAVGAAEIKRLKALAAAEDATPTQAAQPDAAPDAQATEDNPFEGVQE